MSEPKQEIRIAVVMYGGVSLCIYIHGVAQELLRLVRATSGAQVNDDEVTKIYQDLANNVRSIAHPEEPERVRTRFVIDVLSGTSAGGINAIFLAKALAIRAKNLDQLRNAWLDKADMDQLLDTKAGPLTSKRSLLKGQWMYEELLKAFRDMNTAPRDSSDGYQQVEQIDLFVTATDLNGVPIPIRLSDQDVNERVHKASFHFEFDAIQVPKIPVTDICTTQAPDLPGKNHFEKRFDPLLAFAARCTSSFPVAFPPMKLANIESTIGKTEYAQVKQQYREFFRWIPAQPLVQERICPLEFDDRELADGGYLDNKPFGYVIDALTYRATPMRHARKLFYIDPFPESSEDHSERPHFDFVANATAAAMELPRYETIRGDIARIKASNRLQERLNSLNEEFTERWENTGKCLSDFDEEFKGGGLKERVASYGPGYGTYHFIRVADVTDDLARNIARIRGSVEEEDLFVAIRYLARYWRTLKYAPDAKLGKETENVFLTKFDFSFRMRRLIDLLDWSHKHGSKELSQKLIQQLARLHRTRDRLRSPTQQNPLYPIFGEIGASLSWDTVKGIVQLPEENARQRKAAEIYNSGSSLQTLFRKLVDTVAATWEIVFCHNRQALKELRKEDARFEKYYQSFDFRDMLSLTFLEGSDVSEHTTAEIYRVSPADGIQRDPEKKKLAGTALMDFGAFLNRDWRLNDILWGRLDASERIVSAALPHRDDAAKRKCYINRLRTAILEQEMGLRGMSDPVAPSAKEAIKSNSVTQFLTDRYELPPPPKPKQSVKWLAQASTILGGMFEDDLDRRNRFTKSLKTVGSVATIMVGFLVPHSLGSTLFRYWLSIVFFFCVFLTAAGMVFNKSELRSSGLICTAFVALVWLAAIWVGAYFEQRWLRFLGWLIVLPLAVIFWLGARNLPGAVRSVLTSGEQVLIDAKHWIHGSK